MSGLRNYRRIWDDEQVHNSLRVTFIFGIPVMVINLVLGFALACLFTTRPKPKPFWRMIFSLPILLTPVVIGLNWRVLLNYDFGSRQLLPDLLGSISQLFLSDADQAMPALIAGRCLADDLVCHPGAGCWIGRPARGSLRSGQGRWRFNLAADLVDHDPAAQTAFPGHHPLPLVRTAPGFRHRLDIDPWRSWSRDRDLQLPYLRAHVHIVAAWIRRGDVVRPLLYQRDCQHYPDHADRDRQRTRLHGGKK